MTAVRWSIVVGTVAVAGALVALAGPLDPPAGPVAPSYKTLTEVEPRTAINAANTPGDAISLFKITQPGSYYLTGNIAGVAGKHGIVIAANGVTLDLMGFDLQGVPSSLDGVTCTLTNANDLAVSNGTIRSWDQDGLDFHTFSAINGTLRLLRVSDNGFGIRAGFGYTVSGCSAYTNAGNGLLTGDSCTISDCTAYLNRGGPGISTGSGCTVTNCSAYQNTGSGIGVSSGSTVADCTARLNASDGIACSIVCVIRGNACSFNGNGAFDGAGIHATGGNNRIEGNNCTSADRGIEVSAAGNIIIKNTCAGNTVNWDIVAGNVCLVVQGVTGAAILGNTGGVAPGSTDPNANFTY